jgi:hypothetical protein
LNDSALDATGLNNLTANNNPVYSGGAPFSFVAPDAPTALLTEGQTNPTFVTDPTPEFSAIYNKLGSTDTAVFYQLQVSSDSLFSSTYWDSAKIVMATTSVGSRSPDISYSGSTLASSTQYFWRIKFWDQIGNAGAWSTTTDSFILAGSMAGNGFPSYTPVSGGIQNMRFTYDAVGNITKVTDTSQFGLARTVLYGYDDLYRLTSASTTATHFFYG